MKESEFETIPTHMKFYDSETRQRTDTFIRNMGMLLTRPFDEDSSDCLYGILESKLCLRTTVRNDDTNGISI